MAKLPTNYNTTLAAIDAAIEAQEETRRGHLGASVIGDKCERKLWYGFRWCKEVRFNGRVLRLFSRGHEEEHRLIRWLRLAGVTVHEVDPKTGEQFRFSEHNGHFAGSCDGMCIGLVEAPKTMHLLEFKTSSDKYFKTMQNDGVARSQPKHYVQMQVYMAAFGLDRSYYQMVNKNDDQIYAERIKADASVAIEAKAKALRVIEANEPPQGISDRPDWYECKCCDYHSICHGTERPDVNCRTCVHSTPNITNKRFPGQWYCEKWQQFIPKEAEGEGCDEHRWIPSLLNGLEVVDADESANVIEYQDESGNTVINCGKGELV